MSASKFVTQISSWADDDNNMRLGVVVFTEKEFEALGRDQNVILIVGGTRMTFFIDAAMDARVIFHDADRKLHDLVLWKNNQEEE